MKQREAMEGARNQILHCCHSALPPMINDSQNCSIVRDNEQWAIPLMVSPQAKRGAVRVLMTERSFGVTRACGLMGISRSLYRYRRRRPDSAPLRVRIEEIAAIKHRYGYRRVYLRQRREGWEVNRKRVYRLYREAGLAVRRRKRKRIGLFERKPLPKPPAANVSWSMDFVADGLIGGRHLRCLTVVDDCTRECLAIDSRRWRPCAAGAVDAVTVRLRCFLNTI
jgi:hypothetical protein